MYGTIHRNGYLAAISDIHTNGPYVLPGSKDPLLRSYTGLTYLDNMCALAGLMWANVIDGSAPAVSLYAFYFGGQLTGAVVIMMLEAQRPSAKRTMIAL